MSSEKGSEEEELDRKSEHNEATSNCDKNLTDDLQLLTHKKSEEVSSISETEEIKIHQKEEEEGKEDHALQPELNQPAMQSGPDLSGTATAISTDIASGASELEERQECVEPPPPSTTSP